MGGLRRWGTKIQMFVCRCVCVCVCVCACVCVCECNQGQALVIQATRAQCGWCWGSGFTPALPYLHAYTPLLKPPYPLARALFIMSTPTPTTTDAHVYSRGGRGGGGGGGGGGGAGGRGGGGKKMGGGGGGEMVMWVW